MSCLISVILPPLPASAVQMLADLQPRHHPST